MTNQSGWDCLFLVQAGANKRRGRAGTLLVESHGRKLVHLKLLGRKSWSKPSLSAALLDSWRLRKKIFCA